MFAILENDSYIDVSDALIFELDKIYQAMRKSESDARQEASDKWLEVMKGVFENGKEEKSVSDTKPSINKRETKAIESKSVSSDKKNVREQSDESESEGEPKD